ncbi:hypothetical protein M0R89_07805 [Halorussus limi]|uniref:Uncharacterized protein n=1 Tax=Halorussus limi TaxID=2938695 RepID=A0A8U0HZJ8_9EURY|nr:hypothetical protein [Halorussus limi]UPV75954.1 hypothetical protein M0R89_07805 [Halorussus limi]
MTTTQSPLSQATDDRLSQMLFQGEEVEEEFTVEGARVAVTTHRVLVFTPDGDGRRFDHADRPNVLDATVETTGSDSYVGWGVRSGVYGAVLFGGGVLLQTSGILDSLSGVTPPEDAPGAGIAQLVSVLPKALGMLTTVLLVGGGLLVVGALALVALYFSSRERELVIERAGRDPMRVPVSDDDAEDVARRLRAAVGTGSKPRSD